MIEWITRYLDENDVDYLRITHAPAFTTEDVAEAAHTPAMQIAKTVIFYSDGEYGMAVVPGGRMVGMDRLRHVTGGKEVRVAHEHEFAHRFPQCELGAMPPFGHLYGMRVLVDRELTEHEDILFNGGSHTELIRMPYREFRRLVHPLVVELSEHELV